MVAVFERTSKQTRRAARLAAVAIVFAAALAAAAAATMVAAAPALAGEYHVYSCRTPSGESAPADGWSGSRDWHRDLSRKTRARSRAAR